MPQRRVDNIYRSRVLRLFGWLVTALLGCCLASPVYAAAILVSTTDDSMGQSGECSLRDAIVAANTNSPVAGCAAGEAGTVDNLILDYISGSITLVADLPKITEEVSISGPRADELSIDGSFLYRIFQVELGGVDPQPPYNDTFRVSDLTLEKGATNSSGRGAAIHIRFATAFVSDCHLALNRARNGGAITVDWGTLHVRRSAFFENSATSIGGAILVHASQAHIVNSTFYANHAEFAGEALYNASNDEAGLVVSRTTVNNSTLVNNRTPSHGTIADDDLEGTLQIQNSILQTGPTGGACVGEIISSGYNISDDQTCGFTEVGDMENTDALLEAWGYNGGSTPNFAPTSISPAVDGGDPDGCRDSFLYNISVDQRGEPRANSAEDPCDIGSIELPEPAALLLGLSSLAVLCLLTRSKPT
jgi:CSLREA domain-containing protein